MENNNEPWRKSEDGYPPMMNPMMHGFRPPMGHPMGMPRPQGFPGPGYAPQMQPNFGVGVPSIKLRPPPPKTLDTTEDKFQGPLNRPPIDPVYEDTPNSKEHSPDYRQNQDYFYDRPDEEMSEPATTKDQFKSEAAFADYQT